MFFCVKRCTQAGGICAAGLKGKKEKKYKWKQLCVSFPGEKNLLVNWNAKRNYVFYFFFHFDLLFHHFWNGFGGIEGLGFWLSGGEVMRLRERERERDRDRQTDRDRERQIHKFKDSFRDTRRERERERETIQSKFIFNKQIFQ